MRELTRRALFTRSAAAAAAAVVPWGWPASPPRGAIGRSLTKFVDPLPIPGAGIVVATPRSARHGVTTYAFTQRAITRRLHAELPPTQLWAYDDGSGLTGQSGSFGMAVVARTGSPVRLEITNALPSRYPGWIPVDTRLTPRGDEVRVMTHLHGGFVEAASDGNPTLRPEGFGVGETQTVLYPNERGHQPASLLWFHDHGMGTTRLNVFAGLAAAYLVRDEFDTGGSDNANGLPSGAYEIPLVVQDRSFSADGSLLYPRSDIDGVTWIGEYFGDVMLVNGKVWPYLDVEPRLYRFRILNGCNARILALDIGGAPMWQIGAEGGMWTRPVRVKQLVLAPAERADVLVDFSSLAGVRTVVKNRPLPPEVSNPAPLLTTVMELRVGASTSATAVIPEILLGGRDAAVGAPTRRRFITLNEVGVDTASWRLTLNGDPFDAAPTELPRAGAIEEWVYVNLTGDTHPMHPHLVTFEVVGRVPFDVDAYVEAVGAGPGGVRGGVDPTPFATGPMSPADPTERGFKDTVKANPGMFTIVRAQFDLPSGVRAPQSYVHHCHIVEHEDNEMMRPFVVTP